MAPQLLPAEQISAADRRALDLLALSRVKGLGDDGIAAVLAHLRQSGQSVEELFDLTSSQLRQHFRMRAGPAGIISRQAERLREQALPFLEKTKALGVTLLAPGDPLYPVHIESVYAGRPPLLYVHGNVELLTTPCVAILNSAKPSPQALDQTLGLARRLAEAGQTLLTSPEGAAYNVVGMAARRASGNTIVVLHKSIFAFLPSDGDRDPMPLSRRLQGRFDRQHTLLVSPFRLDGRWQKGNGPRRDALLAALAHKIIAIQARAGGTIHKLCERAVEKHRTVFVCQQETSSRASAESALVAQGALPLVGDPGGSNVDLVLRDLSETPRPEGLDDLERRRGLGQFFTPTAVAEFMWDMVHLLRGHKLPTAARIIDPACGEGIFLQVARARGCRPEQLFGADIDETLASSWSTDAALRGARLFRTNGLLENPSIGLEAGSFDVVIGNPPFSGQGMRALLRLLDARTSKNDIPADLNGDHDSKSQPSTVPALPRHERAILDYTMRQLSRYACWRLRDEADDDGGAAVSQEPPRDWLFADFDPSGDRPLQAADYDRMAQLMSDWPDDQMLELTSADMRQAVRRLAATALEVYFTERFVQLAKPGGMIAIIVPESILASEQLAGLRRWFLEETRLLAVVSLPNKVFTGVGANARTGIIFARRNGGTGIHLHNVQPGDRNANVVMVSPNEAEPLELEQYLSGIVNHARSSWQDNRWED